MTREPGPTGRHAFSLILFALAALLGFAALGYPFVAASLGHGAGRAADAPLIVAGLLTLCVLGMLVEAQSGSLNARGIALMGVLVALNSALRLVENIIPGPGEFSPVFALIILAGYVFGARFGFLTGALTLLVSAVITAGIGPWLPYQMFTAGWVGMSAGWLPGRGSNWPRWKTLALLAGFGILWGFAYGAILNLSFWYVLAGDPTTAWVPGLGVGAIIARYGGFYAVTSFVPDLFRALGNAALLVVFGPPTLKALRRARRQLAFEREAE